MTNRLGKLVAATATVALVGAGLSGAVAAASGHSGGGVSEAAASGTTAVVVAAETATSTSSYGRGVVHMASDRSVNTADKTVASTADRLDVPAPHHPGRDTLSALDNAADTAAEAAVGAADETTAAAAVTAAMVDDAIRR